MIPVFLERLPHSDAMSCVCDAKLDLPAGPLVPQEEAQEFWQRLLARCQEAPKASLASFTKDMSRLPHSESARRVPARAYMLSFQAGGREVVHPVVVMLRADS
jgi:hypothetical protein